MLDRKEDTKEKFDRNTRFTSKEIINPAKEVFSRILKPDLKEILVTSPFNKNDLESMKDRLENGRISFDDVLNLNVLANRVSFKQEVDNKKDCDKPYQLMKDIFGAIKEKDRDSFDKFIFGLHIPLNGYERGLESQKWLGLSNEKNCYSVAMDFCEKDGKGRIPGEYSGINLSKEDETNFSKIFSVTSKDLAYFGKKIIPIKETDVCPVGMAKVAAFMDSDNSYHFAFHLTNGCWGNKLSRDFRDTITSFNGKGKNITNPYIDKNMGFGNVSTPDYKYYMGCFAVSTNSKKHEITDERIGMFERYKNDLKRLKENKDVFLVKDDIIDLAIKRNPEYIEKSNGKIGVASYNKKTFEQMELINFLPATEFIRKLNNHGYYYQLYRGMDKNGNMKYFYAIEEEFEGLENDPYDLRICI